MSAWALRPSIQQLKPQHLQPMTTQADIDFKVPVKFNPPGWAEKLAELCYDKFQGHVPHRLIPDHPYNFFREMNTDPVVYKGMICMSMYQFKVILRCWQEQNTL